jgi:hypothetical protein
MVTTFFWTRMIVAMVAGGLGAALTNRGIVLFNDALRSVMPEMIEKRMPRGKFARLACSSTIGLLVAFGLPFSLVAPILLSHALWLGTDVIGSVFPGPFEGEGQPGWKHYGGLAGATACGALFGGVLLLALQSLQGLGALLPVNFFPAMGQLGALVILTLTAIPPLTIAYQYGAKHGLAVFALALLVRQGSIRLGGSQPDTWAFLVGILALLVYAVREASRDAGVDGLAPLDAKRLARLRRGLPWVAVLGAVYAISASLGQIMEGPQTLLALSAGNRLAAVDYSVARALSFLPMRVLSMLATGVYTMEGLGFAPVAGLAISNVWLAAAAGAAIMSAEALGMVGAAKFLCRFPSLLKLANSLRTAMTKLMELASLVGGLIAANSLAPGYGLAAAAGLYALNEAAGTPVIRVAVGPLVILLVGLSINLLAAINLR